MQKMILTFLTLTHLIVFGCSQQKSYNYINVSVEEADHLLTIFVNEEPVAINYSSGIGSINVNPYLIPGSNSVSVSGRIAAGSRPNAKSVIKIFSHDGNVFGNNVKLLNKLEFESDSFSSKKYMVTTNLENISSFTSLESIPKDYDYEEIINYLNDYFENIEKFFVAKQVPNFLNKHERKIIKSIYEYKDFTYYFARPKDIQFVKGQKTVLFYPVTHKLIYFAGHSDSFKGKTGSKEYSLSCDMIRFGYKNGKLEKIW